MNDHYYTAEPTSAHDIRTIRVSALGVEAAFRTDAGVFSRDDLDVGTRVLLESLPELRGRLLDLGCGWGPVGTLLGMRYPDLTIVMSLSLIHIFQQLRSKGVEVRFEKERLSSLDASSEMIFSMMAAIAQDESRSISQNIRWGYEKRFAQRRAFKSGRSACLRKCVSGAPEPPAADFLSKYSKGEMESAAFFVISAGET